MRRCMGGLSVPAAAGAEPAGGPAPADIMFSRALAARCHMAVL